MSVLSLDLLERYVTAWNNGTPEEVVALCAPQVVYHDLALGKMLNRPGLLDFIATSRAHVPDLHFDILDACADARSIAWDWRMSGTHINGTRIDTRGMSMTEFRDGLIIRNRDYWSKASPKG